MGDEEALIERGKNLQQVCPRLLVVPVKVEQDVGVHNDHRFV